MGRAIPRLAALIGAVAGATAVAAAAASDFVPLDGGGATPQPPWHLVGLPAQKKPYTRFVIENQDGARVLRIDADRSYGNLVEPLPALQPAGHLAWRWRVDVPNGAADLHRKSGDDRAVEVCALFDLPLDRLSFVDRQVLRMARALTSEPLPSASVCYVWDQRVATGTMIDDAFTRRVRMIVLRGEGSAAGVWTAERRDLAADFLRLFGDETREVPPLVGIGVSGDADNTQLHTLAYIADLVLEP